MRNQVNQQNLKIQAPQVQPQQNPPRPGNIPQQPRKVPNIEGLKFTLNSLIEERKSLEDKLSKTTSQQAREDYQFELDLAASNIKTL